MTWARMTAPRDAPLKRVSGWAIDHQPEQPIEQTLITDRDGFLRGLGVLVGRDADIGGAELPEKNFPWTGFLGKSISLPPYRAFGVLDDSLVCDLNLKTGAPGSPAR